MNTPTRKAQRRQTMADHENCNVPAFSGVKSASVTRTRPPQPSQKIRSLNVHPRTAEPLQLRQLERRPLRADCKLVPSCTSQANQDAEIDWRNGEVISMTRNRSAVSDGFLLLRCRTRL